MRKKLHIGEFQEFGFLVEAEFKPNLKASESDRAFDEFIDEIEANKLGFSGGSSPDGFQGFVTAIEKYQSPNTAHREKIKKWLENRIEISKYEVGNLVDAWYD